MKFNVRITFRDTNVSEEYSLPYRVDGYSTGDGVLQLYTYGQLRKIQMFDLKTIKEIEIYDCEVQSNEKNSQI